MKKNRLKQLRRQRGYTQPRLCILTGIDPATMSRIETGVLKGGPKHRRLIARALNVNVDEIWPEASRGNLPGNSSRRYGWPSG